MFQETQTTKISTEISALNQDTAPHSATGFIKKSLCFWLIAYFIIQLIGQIPATIWVLFTQVRFAWHTTEVGLSLAFLGVLHIFFKRFSQENWRKNGENATRLSLACLLMHLVAYY